MINRVISLSINGDLFPGWVMEDFCGSNTIMQAAYNCKCQYGIRNEGDCLSESSDDDDGSSSPTNDGDKNRDGDGSDDLVNNVAAFVEMDQPNLSISNYVGNGKVYFSIQR